MTKSMGHSVNSTCVTDAIVHSRRKSTRQGQSITIRFILAVFGKKRRSSSLFDQFKRGRGLEIRIAASWHIFGINFFGQQRGGCNSRRARIRCALCSKVASTTGEMNQPACNDSGSNRRDNVRGKSPELLRQSFRYCALISMSSRYNVGRKTEVHNWGVDCVTSYHKVDTKRRVKWKGVGIGMCSISKISGVGQVC